MDTRSCGSCGLGLSFSLSTNTPTTGSCHAVPAVARCSRMTCLSFSRKLESAARVLSTFSTTSSCFPDRLQHSRRHGMRRRLAWDVRYTCVRPAFGTWKKGPLGGQQLARGKRGRWAAQGKALREG
eukprot:361921-Chlamydomonas_euryale.AAC.21